MTDLDWRVAVVVALFVAGIAVAALAAAAEMALSMSYQARLRARAAEAGGRRGRALLALLDDPGRTWAILLLGHTLGLTLSVAGAVYVLDRGPALSPLVGALAVALLALALLVVVMVLPRAWAARDPEAALLAMARPLAGFATVLAPVLWLVRRLVGLTERSMKVSLAMNALPTRDDELRALVTAGEESGVIEEGEMEMIAGIFDLSQTRAREVMVPRIDVVALPVETPVSEALAAVIAAGHSRIPVYRSTIDDIAGVLYAKDLLPVLRDHREDVPLASLLRPAHFVPESKPVDVLLSELQHRRVHMAIVVDEFGGTAGLVTIEDLIEEIVGEIEDEYDVDAGPRIERLSADEVVCHAGVDIDDVNDLMDIHLPTDEVDTLAGLVFTELGKVPEVGERAHFEDAEIEVLALAGRRIHRVRVRRRGAEPAPEPAAPPQADAPRP
jgi:CBS domain containing-hemolysin-like protein